MGASPHSCAVGDAVSGQGPTQQWLKDIRYTDEE